MAKKPKYSMKKAKTAITEAMKYRPEWWDGYEGLAAHWLNYTDCGICLSVSVGSYESEPSCGQEWYYRNSSETAEFSQTEWEYGLIELRNISDDNIMYAFEDSLASESDPASYDYTNYVIIQLYYNRFMSLRYAVIAVDGNEILIKWDPSRAPSFANGDEYSSRGIIKVNKAKAEVIWRPYYVATKGDQRGVIARAVSAMTKAAATLEYDIDAILMR